MAKNYSKYAVYDVEKDERLPVAFCTATLARRAICNWYAYSPKRAKNMWVLNTETGLCEGMVERYNHYGVIEYYYLTTDGKERKINEDGTFVRKKTSSQYGIKGKLRPFGL